LILDNTADAARQSPIAGDPPIYSEIATAILDGEIPYLDLTVEHFPIALVPMLLIGGLSRISNVSFPTLWPFAMGLLFVISVAIANGIPARFDYGRRYLLFSLPLLPLALFRVEPWLMVWVVASLSLAFRSAWKMSSLATIVASLTKGWPVILFALPFRSGHRRVAIWAGLTTVVILVFVSLLPGFREGRAFEGIHTETLVGNAVLVYRGLTGANPQLIGTAGATYLAADALAVLLNIAAGLLFVVLGFRALSRTSEIEALTTAAGLVVLGIILSSPLFSAQFVFWLVPFVLFLGLRNRILYLVAGVTTLATVIWWEPSGLSWSLLVLGRNVALVALGAFWAASIHRATPAPKESEHVA
jgi:hypothetical protein